MLAEESGQNEKNPFGDEQSKTEIQHVVYFQSLLSLDFGLDFCLKEKNNFNTSVSFVATLFTSDIAQPPELS